MKQGDGVPAKHDLSSLRLLGSVGEPINPEAWLWYHEHIGGGKAPDRRHVVADRDGHDPDHAAARRDTTTKPGSATFPFPGIGADVVDGDGKSVPLGGGGYLVLKRPWPAMLRGIYGDPSATSRPTGAASRGSTSPVTARSATTDGYFWLLGRVDDVMNVSGHRHLDDRGRERARVDHPRWPRRRSSARPTRSRARRSSRSSSSRRERADDALGDELREHVARSHRPDRQAEVPDVHAGPAQDPLGQDHAPAAARHRRGPAAGRHDDARRRGGRRDDPRAAPARPRSSVPFDFLQRRKAETAASPAAAAGATASRAGRGVAVRRPDRGVADRRPDGHQRAPVRRPQQARGDHHRRRPAGRRSTARRASPRRPGSRAIDPYDLILVLAGEGDAAAAHRRRSGPPTRSTRSRTTSPSRRRRSGSIGTVYLYPGLGAGAAARPRDRDVRAGRRRGRLRYGDSGRRPDVDAVLVNRFYLRGVEQIDKRTGDQAAEAARRAARRHSWQDRSR